MLRLAAQIVSTPRRVDALDENARRLFNNAVFEAALVSDGKAAEARSCEPFDLSGERPIGELRDQAPSWALS